MLLHIRPKLYAPWRTPVMVRVVEIRELGLRLDDRSVTERQPYPHKDCWVVCRKSGRKAIDGLLIETDRPVDYFHVHTEWLIKDYVVSHSVEYRILDHDFGAASDNIMLWRGTSKELGGWPSRIPRSLISSSAPKFREPSMAFFEEEANKPDTEDRVVDGIITERRQIFSMPTLERERLVGNELNSRLPLIKDAFNAKQPRCRIIPERPVRVVITRDLSR
jgi:hypothetical protein